MRSLVYFMHSSLDGFVAGTKGEMNWISVDDELFEFVSTLTDQADTALYGRVTYQMMEAYWPTAGEKLNASKHDKEHSVWYKNASKVVLSRTINETGLRNTKIIRDDLLENITKLKQQPGKNILIFGSPRASHSLLSIGLIDEYWIFVNPVLLGQGIPLFKDVTDIVKLKLIESKTFTSGVVALHYGKAKTTFEYRFTLEQIHEASAKVKSGADFPQLVQDLKEIGVTHYDIFVPDGRTTYYGLNDFTLKKESRYSEIRVNDISSPDSLKNAILIHQRGQTDYPMFCQQAADSGVEKWTTHMLEMAVTYFDKKGHTIVVEPIPKPS